MCAPESGCMQRMHRRVVGSVVVGCVGQQPGVPAPCGACPMQQCEYAHRHAFVLHTPCARGCRLACWPTCGVLCLSVEDFASICRPVCMHAWWSTQPAWHIRGWHSCPCLSFHVACYRAGSRAVPAVLCLPHLPSDGPGCAAPNPVFPVGSRCSAAGVQQQQWLACEGLMHTTQALLAHTP